METVDGQIVSFYHDHAEKVSPLERIPEFDGGDFWIVDAELSGYNTYPEDNSFVMVPKQDVKRVWFEPYTTNAPKVIGKVK